MVNARWTGSERLNSSSEPAYLACEAQMNALADGPAISAIYQ